MAEGIIKGFPEEMEFGQVCERPDAPPIISSVTSTSVQLFISNRDNNTDFIELLRENKKMYTVYYPYQIHPPSIFPPFFT